jgi:hypothetical protein
LYSLKNEYLLSTLIFATQYLNMAQQLEQSADKKEFGRNWVISSRFLFHVQIFTFTAFLLGSCYGLYSARYKGKPKVEVPESSQYTPKYK